VQVYRFFVRQPGGSFSSHQTMPLPTERAARVHAEALYAVYGGVDLWDESRRIALMMEEPSSITNPNKSRPS
jgi:hypothetical protein